ncbi:capsular polysaccharide biosynthesis protein CapK [Brucella endophytica]|uniref:Capsular polysaccharide biosynthesis protein CapK n=1 Tax=Brucella endophytica TaxID=1963359 RepID=A0A916WK07_9HYPH|nr:AMP-binding protein [Brucella endophytica]GGB07324.1 capsular polysaccharide biosynthesis protein CapK [Brucella endophytica]
MGATAYLKNSIAENLVRRTPGIYAHLTKLILRSEKMALDERRTLRDALTNQTLATARKTPYGRTMAALTGYDQWPLLEKETLSQNPHICLARTLIPPAAASTGGTTGVPVALKRSLEAVVFEQAALDHLVRRQSGLEMKTARTAILRGDMVKSPDDMSEPYWRVRQGGRQLICSSFHLNASTSGSFIEAIRSFQPQMLWVYPSSLEAFARLGATALKDGGLPGLKLVLASSEVLDAGVSGEISDILQVPVIDFYGQAERVCASYAIRPDEHYFLPAYGRVELIPAYDEDESSLYEIVGTSYWNAAQPLVRFRTGDLARLPRGLSPDELDAVTLGLLPFQGIEGRRTDYVLSPDGRRLIGMNHIPRGVPGIAQMQIIQKSLAEIEIHVVPLKDFGEGSTSAILANARQKIPSSIDVVIKTVESVTRTKSGKAPLVRRLVD